MFIEKERCFLSTYLRNLQNGNDIEKEIHRMIGPYVVPGIVDILYYNMSTMETVLKIMMILKALKVKNVPENFMQYFDPIESLDSDHLQYVNYEPRKLYAKKMEEEIDNIYKRVMKDTK